MGKASGVSKRRRKASSQKYTRSKQLKRTRRQQLKKFNGIADDIVRGAWDHKKSLKINMNKMGLANDPNKLLRPANFHEEVAKKREEMMIDEIDEDMVTKTAKKINKKKQKYKARKLNQFDVESIDDNGEDPNSSKVATKLAIEASKPRPKIFRLGPDQIKFCVYMLEKYKEDYEAMARDKLNHYQESAGQIRTKIKKFMSNESQRSGYEKAKQIFFDESEDCLA